MPQSHANMTPVSVSLVEEMCETSTNYLNIIYNLPTGEKEKFAVCVKGLDFPMEDRSVRLVEWIEATMNLPPQIYYSYHDIHIRMDKICCFLCLVGAGENLKVLFELSFGVVGVPFDVFACFSFTSLFASSFGKFLFVALCFTLT